MLTILFVFLPALLVLGVITPDSKPPHYPRMHKWQWWYAAYFFIMLGAGLVINTLRN